MPVPLRPPGSLCLREGRGPRGVVGGGPRDFPCPRVPACRACPPPCPVIPVSPDPAVLVSPPGPHPQVALCPRPHGFVSPWSLCAPPRRAGVPEVPLSPWSGCVPRQFPHGRSRVPWSPHGPSSQSPCCVPTFPQSPDVPCPHHVLGVRACPHDISVSRRSRCPFVSTVLVSPWCPFAAVPVSPVSPQHPRMSPRCPHIVPACPHIVPPCPQAELARCQREAEEVAELMRQNLARALEREGHLEQLQSRAQDLRRAVGQRGHAGTRGAGQWRCGGHPEQRHRRARAWGNTWPGVWHYRDTWSGPGAVGQRGHTGGGWGLYRDTSVWGHTEPRGHRGGTKPQGGPVTGTNQRGGQHRRIHPEPRGTLWGHRALGGTVPNPRRVPTERSLHPHHTDGDTAPAQATEAVAPGGPRPRPPPPPLHPGAGPGAGPGTVIPRDCHQHCPHPSGGDQAPPQHCRDPMTATGEP